MSAPALMNQFKSGYLSARDVVALVPSVLDFVAPEAISGPTPSQLNIQEGAGPFDWLTRVYSLTNRGQIDEAMDLVFDSLLDLQTAGDFAKCDEALDIVDVGGLDTNLMIGFLSATLQAKQKLHNRAKLLHQIEAALREIAPDRVESLIGGLR